MSKQTAAEAREDDLALRNLVLQVAMALSDEENTS